MAIIYVPDNLGIARPVKIAGDKPTASEQGKIDNWLADINSKYSTPQAPAPKASLDQPSGFFPAIASGLHSTAAGIGSLIEAGGQLTGLSGVEKWGKEQSDIARKLAQEDLPNPTQWQDVHDIPSGARYLAENIGTSLGAYAPALVATGLAGPEAGAAIIAGTAAGTPIFAGSNLERQKAETGKMGNIGGAVLAAPVQALTETVVDAFTLHLGPFARVIPKPLLTSKVAGILAHTAKSAGLEAAQEVSQQMLERLQAGLPIDDDAAMQEYAASAIAAASMGGVLGGIAESPSLLRKKNPEADRQLEEDIRKEGSDLKTPSVPKIYSRATAPSANALLSTPYSPSAEPLLARHVNAGTGGPSPLGLYGGEPTVTTNQGQVPSATYGGPLGSQRAVYRGPSVKGPYNAIAPSAAGWKVGARGHPTLGPFPNAQVAQEAANKANQDIAARNQAAIEQRQKAEAQAARTAQLTVENLTTQQAARETILPPVPMKMEELPGHVQQAIQVSRLREGKSDLTAPATIEEIKSVDSQAAQDAIRVQKPVTAGTGAVIASPAPTVPAGAISSPVVPSVPVAAKTSVASPQGVLGASQLLPSIQNVSQEQFDAALGYIQQSGRADFQGIRKAAGLTAPQARVVRKVIEDAGQRPLADYKPSDTIPEQPPTVAPGNTYRYSVEPHVSDNAGEPKVNYAVVQREYNNDGKPVSKSILSLHPSQEDATQEAAKAVAPSEAPIPGYSTPQAETTQEPLTTLTDAPVAASRAAIKARTARWAPALARLKSYMGQLGLHDVGIKLESTLDGLVKSSGAEKFRPIIEGVYLDKLIKLSTDIYDPSFSDAEIEAKLASVLSHEVIHAMRAMGLFKPAEWSVLSNWVSKNHPMVDGKPRAYTYLDKAKRLYQGKPGYNQDAIVEEAVADAFRAWSTDHSVVGGQPAGLFRRIVNFVKQLFKAQSDPTVKEIFSAINEGAVGKRDRQPLLSVPPKAALKEGQEGIRAAAIKVGDRVWEAPMHFQAMLKAEEDLGVADFGDQRFHGPAQGFITTTGRFVDRYEAMEIAQAADQVKKGFHPHWIDEENNIPDSALTAEETKWLGSEDLKKYSLKGQQQYNPNEQDFNPPYTTEQEKNADSEGKPTRYTYRYSVNDLGHIVPPVNEVLPNGPDIPVLYNRTNEWLSSNLGKVGVKNSAPKIESFLTWFQDKMLPVGRLVDHVRQNGGIITTLSDPYLRADLMSSIAGAQIKLRGQKGGIYKTLAEKAIATGLTNADLTHLGSLDAKFERFLKDGVYKDSHPSEPMLDLYFMAKDAVKRNEYLGERTNNPAASGLTTPEAAKIIDFFRKHPSFARVVNAEMAFRQIIADTNRIRYEAGLITKEQLEGGWSDYAPIRGFLEEDIKLDPDLEDDDYARTGQGFNVRGSEDPHATGRSRMGARVIANAILQNQTAIIRGEKNKVGQALGRMIDQNKALTAPFAEHIETAPVKKAMVNGKERLVVDPTYKNRDAYYTYKVDGKEQVIQFSDTRVGAAMKNLSAPDSNNIVLKGLQWVNHMLTRVNTTLNPEFFISNFVRDLFTAGINLQQYEKDGLLKNLLGNIKQSWQAARAEIRQGEGGDPAMRELYKELYRNGGITEFYGLRSLESTAKEVNKLISEDLAGQAGLLDPGKKAFRSVKNFIEDYNTVFENTTRLAVYKTMKETLMAHGMLEEAAIARASQAAKNITVNFNRSGNGKIIMNSLYLFYNASLQGTFTILNAGLRSKKVRRIMGGIILGGVIQDAINSALSPEDDDGKLIYDKIPLWQREHNMIFMDPLGLTDRGYFMIPMPYGYNAFWNAGRAAMQMVRGGDVSESLGSVMMAAINGFNPINGTADFINFSASTVVNAFAPTVAKPFLEVALNKDFTGAPIEPEQSSFGVKKPESQNFWANTNPAYKWVAKTIAELTGEHGSIPGYVEWSPEHIQYWTEYLTGGVGTFVRRASGVGYNGLQAASTGSWGEFVANDIPLARRLYGNISSRNDLTEYVNSRDHILTVRKTVLDALKNGDRDLARYTMERYSSEWKISGMVNALNNQRMNLQSKIRSIESNTNISPERKSAMIDRLKTLQDQIVGRANKLMNAQ